MFYKILDFLNDLRPRQIFLLAGASTIIMFATVYFIFNFMTPSVEEESKTTEQPKYLMENVVVVKTDIAARTVFTEDMLQVKQVPKDLAPESAVTNLRSIVGQSAGVTMYAGDIVTEQKIHIENFTSSFVDSIPKDCRAVSVGIGNITGVAGFAKAGDFVDVILVQKNDSSANSRLILQNVLLLSINKNAGEDVNTSAVPKSSKNVSNSAAAAFDDMQNSTEPEDPVIATLALRPQEAMELVSAAALGEIYLTLRPENPMEETVADTDYTMQGITAPTPANVIPSTAPTSPVTANVPSSIPLPPSASTPPAPVIQGSTPPSFEIIQGDQIVGK